MNNEQFGLSVHGENITRIALIAIIGISKIKITTNKSIWDSIVLMDVV